jgi:hypothetical protein
MKHRYVGLLILFVLGILAALQASQALRGDIPVIGILMPTSAEVAAPALQAFRQALDARGAREGQSYVVESRFADGAYERLPALATELVRLRVDVLLAGSPAMIRTATQVTTVIPIVGIGVRTGLFTRLTRPAANLTGVGTGGEEAYRRAQTLLQAVVPGLSRVAILWGAHSSTTGQTWLTLAARLTGTAVATTIGKGLVGPSVLSLVTVIAGLAGAMTRSLCTYAFGIPVSETHGLIGGLVGTAMATAGVEVVQWQGITKVLVAIVASPVLGFIGGFGVIIVIYIISP